MLERCTDLLLRCGADLQRITEGRDWTVERFTNHIRRMPAVAGNGIAPLVLLTRTNPLALAVLQTRRVLEEAVPGLARASWIIFHDEQDDPFFVGAASELGSFDVAYEHGPIWTTSSEQRFLILGTHAKHLEFAAGRLAEFEVGSMPESGLRRITPRGSVVDARPPIARRTGAGFGR